MCRRVQAKENRAAGNVDTAAIRFFGEERATAQDEEEEDQVSRLDRYELLRPERETLAWDLRQVSSSLDVIFAEILWFRLIFRLTQASGKRGEISSCAID